MPAAKKTATVRVGSPRLGRPRQSKAAAAEVLAGPVAGLPKTGTLGDAKHQNEVLRGRLLQIELAIKGGQLVDRAAQEKKDFELWRTARDAIRQIPRRVAAEVHAAESVSAVQRVLARELDDALRTLCDRLDAMEARHAD